MSLRIVETYLLRSAIYNARGNCLEAIADCNAALRLDPKSATAYNKGAYTERFQRTTRTR